MIAIVVATSKNGIIGIDNKLPWHLPKDLQYFKSLTMRQTVVMGRKTYQSIGRPLAGRNNIVLSRNKNYNAGGVLIARNIAQALQMANNENIFIIGGLEVYKVSLRYADTIYLTLIHENFKGDTPMFGFDKSIWKKVDQDNCSVDEANPYNYSHIIYKRNFPTLNN